MRQLVCENGNVVRVGPGRTEVVLNSGRVVVGVPQRDEEQAQTAAELGYDDPVRMVEDHDPLHAMLSSWIGLESFALRVAAGELAEDDIRASIEEDAVLALQKFMRVCGGRMPGAWSLMS